MAAICALPAGAALFTAIIVVVAGRMALAIPGAWNRAQNIGRAEERDRMRSILAKRARRDPGTGALVIALDQDAEERLRNGSG